jgi:peroxiredoxin
MREDIRPGARFPDYELPDHTGARRKLSELQGNDPMILVLSRGAFCPKDRQQHRLLVELEPEVRVAYTKIVTISTDGLLELNEMRTGVDAHWPFLSDVGRRIQKDLDIAEYTDPQHNPMVPHTILLEPGLVIYRIYNGYWYWGRPSNEDLRRDLREITQKIRPDWDLAAPGLREAWQRGDKSRFWPYDRSLKEVLAEAS